MRLNRHSVLYSYNRKGFNIQIECTAESTALNWNLCLNFRFNVYERGFVKTLSIDCKGTRNATDGPILIQNTFDQLGQTITNVLKNVLLIENYIEYSAYIRSDAHR